MYAAAKTEDLKEKAKILGEITNDIAAENDWRAYNSLGILYINEFLQTRDKSNLEIAQNNLDKANAISPNNGRVLNNLGIFYFLNGQKEDAKKTFESAQKSQIEPIKQDYNLGLFKILDGDYSAAQQAMGNRSCDYSMALTQLLNKDYPAAKTTLDCIQPKDAKAFYLSAVLAARQNNETDAINNLRSAIELDGSYKREALKDAEFKRLKKNGNFQYLLK
jgi:Flp pilus assembly protein TadD